MNVLFLTGDIPYPTNTGARIRTFNLIKHAQKDAKVTVATMVHDEGYAGRLGVLREHCAGVEFVSKPPSSVFEFYGGLFKSLFSSRPFIVDKHQYAPYTAKVQQLLKSGKFDLVHCDSISLAPIVMTLTTIPTLLTEHNMEAIIWQRYYEEEKAWARRWYIKQQYKKIFQFEKAACKAVDLVVAVSDEDKVRLKSQYGVDNAVVVPNGVDTDFFSPRETPVEADSIVFTGSMDWRPNQDAIYYFYETIWPRIVAKRPKAKFWIVGRKPPDRIVAMGKMDKRITVTGTVDDVRDYTARGAVYVVPLRIGGGSRLKILEALAMKKAIVSTTIGAEGLHLADGKDLILADSPDTFANQVVSLFDDATKRASLGEHGCVTILKQYDWRSVAKLQVAAWQASIDRFAARRTSPNA